MNINIHYALELVQNLYLFSVGSPADKLQEVYKPVLTDTECLTNIGGAYDPEYPGILVILVLSNL
jgi:hypothetical protein